MHHYMSDIVLMFINSFNFLIRVIVVDANFVIVCTHNYPLLSRYEFSSSHRCVCHFDRPNLRLLLIVVDTHVARVE